MRTEPQPESFKTRAEDRWAKKMWLRHHGGYLITTLAIALFFGALTGATVLLVVPALVMTAVRAQRETA